MRGNVPGFGGDQSERCSLWRPRMFRLELQWNQAANFWRQTGLRVASCGAKRFAGGSGTSRERWYRYGRVVCGPLRCERERIETEKGEGDSRKSCYRSNARIEAGLHANKRDGRKSWDR